MFNKPRKTASLLILESLNKRTSLSRTYQTSHKRLHQGHIGELYFAKLILEQLKGSHIKLYGLQLKTDGSEFQIDCTLIFQHEIYLIEIKNFAGNYYFSDDNFYITSTNKAINNPLQQLKRSEILLQNILTEKKSTLQLRSVIIFTNPEFYLYQAPMNKPIIYPNQLNHFIHSLKSKPINLNNQHEHLSNSLKSAHLPISAFEQIPEYNYNDLKKGIVCLNCNGFMRLIEKRNGVICPKCNIIESLNAALVRNIEEFYLLFPDKEITVSSIYEWCDFIPSRRKIQYILRKNFLLNKKGRYSYYTSIN